MLVFAEVVAMLVTQPSWPLSWPLYIKWSLESLDMLWRVSCSKKSIEFFLSQVLVDPTNASQPLPGDYNEFTF
jgi:hypothetical protein